MDFAAGAKCPARTGSGHAYRTCKIPSTCTDKAVLLCYSIGSMKCVIFLLKSAPIDRIFRFPVVCANPKVRGDTAPSVRCQSASSLSHGPPALLVAATWAFHARAPGSVRRRVRSADGPRCRQQHLTRVQRGLHRWALERLPDLLHIGKPSVSVVECTYLLYIHMYRRHGLPAIYSFLSIFYAGFQCEAERSIEQQEQPRMSTLERSAPLQRPYQRS